MQSRQFGLKGSPGLLALMTVLICLSAPTRADVTIEAVWSTSQNGGLPAEQKTYVSGSHVRIDGYGGLAPLVLFDGAKRFAVGPAGKTCIAETADALRQFVRSTSDVTPRVEWKVKSLDQTRDIGQWKCKVYQVSEHRMATAHQPASTQDIPSKEICVVPYSELPNGEEVQRAAHAMTRFMAPLESLGEAAGLIEQTPAVSAAVNGFVVAAKPLEFGNQAELTVKSWNVEPIAKDVFTEPAACEGHGSLPSPVTKQETAEHEISVSSDRTTPHGAWRYRQLRDDTPVICSFNGTNECITHKLRVENSSADTLECDSRMNYDGVNSENLPSMRALGVVMPKQTRYVMSDRAKPGVSLVDATVDCKARPPRARLNVPKECKFQVLEAPPLDNFYPPAARRLSEEGPVELEFTLEQAQGHASAISVVGSSLSARLDQAAVKYLESVTFSTPCPSTHYDLRLLFKLNE